MKIDALRAGQELTRLISREETPEQEQSEGFGDLLKAQLDRIQDTQQKADEMTQSLILGETTDLHSVLLAAEEARITLDAALQIRNKVIEAYKEITNMQI